ncbi:MAG TPA: hypothetical protein ENJ29_02730 [Bacteroidetes bacterium]|nr:hypothetical protein [Bacteroidota bacterium]
MKGTTMKTTARLFLLLALAGFMAMEPTCDGSVDLTVTVESPMDFYINTSTSSYDIAAQADLTDDIRQAMEDANFDPQDIKRVVIERITYIVKDNKSQENTVINLETKVARYGTTDPAAATPLLSVSDVNLTEVEGTSQNPTLHQGGIELIRDILNESLVEGTGRAAFSGFLSGSATPAPPPNIDFALEVSMTITLVAKVSIDENDTSAKGDQK